MSEATKQVQGQTVVLIVAGEYFDRDSTSTVSKVRVRAVPERDTPEEKS